MKWYSGSYTRVSLKTLRQQTDSLCHSGSWRDILEPCRYRIRWGEIFLDKAKRTDMSKSVVTVSISPRGFPSKLRINTIDRLGRRKGYGGDSWKIVITVEDRFSMAVQLRDLLDGSYEGYFILPSTGMYSLHCTLLYSLCDGLRDPPSDWFKMGTRQGQYQKQGTLDQIDVFLNHTLPEIQFEVSNKHQQILRKPLYKPKKSQTRRDQTCSPINDACGYWKDYRFFTFLNEDESSLRSTAGNKESDSIKLGTLLLYGDSLQLYMYHSAHLIQECKQLFNSCINVYGWVYKHINNTHNTYTFYTDADYDGKDFNETMFLSEIREEATREKMLDGRSVLLINFGIHVTMTLPIDRLKHLFQQFLNMISTLKKIYGKRFPNVIWKNTTPPRMEDTIKWYRTPFRFLTRQRVQFWNAYTKVELCKAGIPVLDVNGLASAPPPAGILDHVHFHEAVFKVAEERLFTYIKENVG